MEFMWTEKYKPKGFEELTFNHKSNEKLQNLVSSPNMPHIIFYGPDGSGKKTRINCMLKEIYGVQELKTHKDVYRVKENSKTHEIAIRYSRYHIELSPSDAKFKD